MTPEEPFDERVRAVVDNVAPEGRGDTERMVANLTALGATSDAGLESIARDQGLDRDVRGNACWLLARVHAPQASIVFTDLLADPDPVIREEAAAGLGLVADDDASVARLVDVAQHDASSVVRLSALHALGIISAPRTAPALLALVTSSDDDEIRAAAAESCAHIRDAGIAPALRAALADPSPLVRYSAAYALGQQGDQSAIPALRDLAARDTATTPWGTVASAAQDALDALASRP